MGSRVLLAMLAARATAAPVVWVRSERRVTLRFE
jgi:hypothetical protein